MYKCYNCKDVFKNHKEMTYFELQGWVCSKCFIAFKGFSPKRIELLKKELGLYINRHKVDFDIQQDTAVLLQEFINQYKERNGG